MDFPKSVPSVGLVNGQFVDENPLTGTPGSLIPSAWGNAVTLEVLNAIIDSGQVPAETDVTQLSKAIKTAAEAYGIGSTDGGPQADNADALVATGVYSVGATWGGSIFPGTDPNNQGSIFHRSSFENTWYEVQLFQSMTADTLAFRRKTANAWQPWKVLIHSGNLPLATTTAPGVVRFATQSEVTGGADNNSTVTPLTLKNRFDALLASATTTVAGILRIATQAEVTAGADNNSAVTPLTLKNRLAAVVVGATTTIAGVLRISTNSEVIAGTDISSAVTPGTLAAKLNTVLVGATESVAGFIKIATNDVMAGLSNNSDAVTVAKLRLGFSLLGATNGYIVLPIWLGGLIFQWGETAHTGSDSKTASLPIAFPNGVMKAVGGTFANASVAPQGIVKTVSLNQITTYSTGGYNVSWFAIGW
ncbi:hypothetical protein [Pseudomonas chlororaphis]|uniref:gp53-like domain-containing protein n=1 Tax=Pseudomonas chlororaphis TaxID=587753 RepID=UPI000B0F3481|nr:hypothetical protein [Pseudomonas chlororaphis]